LPLDAHAVQLVGGGVNRAVEIQGPAIAGHVICRACEPDAQRG
jgi:hypothetical protein